MAPTQESIVLADRESRSVGSRCNSARLQALAQGWCQIIGGNQSQQGKDGNNYRAEAYHKFTPWRLFDVGSNALSLATASV